MHAKICCACVTCVKKRAEMGLISPHLPLTARALVAPCASSQSSWSTTGHTEQQLVNFINRLKMKHLKDEPLEPPPIPVPAAPSAATAPSAAAGLAAAAALYSAVAQANAAAAAAAAAAGIPSSKKDDETEEDGEVCVLYNSIPYNAMPVVFFFLPSRRL